MISSIEIENLRGIRKGRVEFPTPLVILVGPNGSGKSTVLDALLIAVNRQPAAAVHEALKRHRGVEQGGRWFVWRGKTSEPAALTVSTTDGESRRYRLHFQENGSFSVQAPIPDGAGQTGHRGHVAVEEPPTPRGSGHPALRWQPIGIASVLAGVSDIRLVEPRAFDNVPPLHQLFTMAVSQGRREEARRIATDLIPGAKNLEILTEGERPIVHVVFEENSVPVAFAGDGIYSLVRLSLELASRAAGVVLLEEPEVHLHPAAIRCCAAPFWAPSGGAFNW